MVSGMAHPACFLLDAPVPPQVPKRGKLIVLEFKSKDLAERNREVNWWVVQFCAGLCSPLGAEGRRPARPNWIAPQGVCAS
ncbi:MAG: hypothetical protein ABSH45_16145, partial [Bryobacteraceae bacterium]